MKKFVFLTFWSLLFASSWLFSFSDADIQLRFLEKIENKGVDIVSKLEKERINLIHWRSLCQKGPRLDQSHLCFHFWMIVHKWRLPSLGEQEPLTLIDRNCEKIVPQIKGIKNINYIIKIKGLSDFCVRIAKTRKNDLIYINR